jgi:hypothetical protein
MKYPDRFVDLQLNPSGCRGSREDVRCGQRKKPKNIERGEGKTLATESGIRRTK